MTVLHRIGDQVRHRLGIHLGPHKEYLLAARLEKLQREEGYPDLEQFYAALESGDPRAVDALARHLTTNHTFFFREPEHFPLLVKLLQAAGVRRPRIWSAAGSTGEEGYSLAITLAEAGFSDSVVLVSDVNHDVLVRAQRGVYDPSRMEKVPPGLVARYFEPWEGSQYRIRSHLRSRLRFRCVNLIDALDVAEPPDVIFCRNLLIYFDPEGVRLVLTRLIDALKPGGWLFLGQTEGFHRPPGPVRQIHSSVFQKTVAP